MSHPRTRQSLPAPAKSARSPVSQHPSDEHGHIVQATRAKNQFGAILKSIRNAEPVFIARHGTAQAVVLDIDSYRALVHKAREPHEINLDALRQEFDALYAKMQTAKSRKAAETLFSASAKQLNQTAAHRAKPRG